MTIRELITFLGFKIDDGTLKEYERKVESAKKKSSDLSNAVGGIGKAVKLIGGVAAAAGITALGKSILDTTGEVEQYRAVLGQMIGDQERANQVIKNLDWGFDGKAALSDYYGTANAVGGLQGLVTFGMEAEKAQDVLYQLGDVAQGNSEAFKSLALNMGQVFAKGKADGTDLKQFVGQGFDVVGEVSKMTGKSRAEIEKAGVSYDQCAAALKHITDEGGKYNGMLAKMSNTLPGLIKQFQSLTAAIKEGIGSNVIDRIKDIMSAVLNLGRSMQDNIVAVGTKAFEAILNAIADVYIAFHLLKQEMEKYGGAFTAIKALLKDVFGFMESLFQSSRPFILAIAKAILLAFKPIEAFVKPVLEALKPLFKDVFGFGADQINGLLPYIDGLTSSFQKAGEFIAKIISFVDSILGKHQKTIIEITKVALASFAAIKAGAKMSQIISSFNHTVKLLGIIGRHPQIILKRINGLKDGIGGLFKFVQKNPMIFVVMAVVTALILIITHLKEIKEWWSNLSTPMKVVVGIIGGLTAAITAAFTAFRAFTAAVSIAKAVMVIFNAICAANPISLVIMAVVAALAAAIAIGVLVYKNWDKIKAGIIKGATAIGNFFKKIWGGIKSVCLAVWDGIKTACIVAFDAVKDAVLFVVDKIKAVWSSITGFFGGLWDGIVSLASSVISKLAEPFSKVLDVIKGLWIGLTDFFSSLWDSLKNGVVSVAEAIGNIFTGLFDGVKNQFFGFINTLKDGWEKVKGFFGGLWDGAVNFFTGSESKEVPEPTKVNDMILTPDGTYSTHPDDTIFAMKNPGSLVDRLAEYFAQAKPEPSYALADSSASQAVRQSVSNDYSRHSSSSVYNTPIHVTVNASGMTAEQARRAVENGVKGALRDAINGSRGTIPSAEARGA